MSDAGRSEAGWHGPAAVRTSLAIPDEPMLILPLIEEVAPNVWSIPQPMPGPLEYSFVYAVELSDGVLLVDTGWASSGGLERLDTALGVLGARLADVRGVILTHAHPDHCGDARRLREETGAWLALHDAEPALVGPRDANLSLDELSGWLLTLGVMADERDGFVEIALRLGSMHTDVVPDRRLVDGTFLELGGCRLEVVHTPGHAPDHACFVDRVRGIVFTGDHILSYTTPNVGIFPGSYGSPLDEYLRSLKRVGSLGPLLALPGHEERVRVDQRAAQLLAHHELQLQRTAELIAAGHETVREIAARMPWQTTWEKLPLLDRYLAVCETYAHVVVLDRRGAIEVVDTRPRRWRAPG